MGRFTGGIDLIKSVVIEKFPNAFVSPDESHHDATHVFIELTCLLHRVIYSKSPENGFLISLKDIYQRLTTYMTKFISTQNLCKIVIFMDDPRFAPKNKMRDRKLKVPEPVDASEVKLLIELLTNAIRALECGNVKDDAVVNCSIPTQPDKLKRLLSHTPEIRTLVDCILSWMCILIVRDIIKTRELKNISIVFDGLILAPYESVSKITNDMKQNIDDSKSNFDLLSKLQNAYRGLYIMNVEDFQIYNRTKENYFLLGESDVKWLPYTWRKVIQDDMKNRPVDMVPKILIITVDTDLPIISLLNFSSTILLSNDADVKKEYRKDMMGESYLNLYIDCIAGKDTEKRVCYINDTWKGLTAYLLQNTSWPHPIETFIMIIALACKGDYVHGFAGLGLIKLWKLVFSDKANRAQFDTCIHRTPALLTREYEQSRRRLVVLSEPWVRVLTKHYNKCNEKHIKKLVSDKKLPAIKKGDQYALNSLYKYAKDGTDGNNLVCESTSSINGEIRRTMWMLNYYLDAQYAPIYHLNGSHHNKDIWYWGWFYDYDDKSYKITNSVINMLVPHSENHAVIVKFLREFDGLKYTKDVTDVNFEEDDIVMASNARKEFTQKIQDAQDFFSTTV